MEMPKSRPQNACSQGLLDADGANEDPETQADDEARLLKATQRRNFAVELTKPQAPGDAPSAALPRVARGFSR